jgi:hypothetical protein
MRPWTLAWVLLLGCGVGCARTQKSYDQYIPSPLTARAALEAALSSWQGGKPPGTIETDSAVIHLVDSCRRLGQRLQSFEVLGEVPGDSPRCFGVRLLLANPVEEQRARFIVVGPGPIWVVRHEDFVMMAHWDQAAMNQEKTKEKTDRPKGP